MPPDTDLRTVQTSPEPLSARSPVADSPDTTEALGSETEKLLLKAKGQYISVCRSESRLRRDMLDDRRFRLGRLGDQAFQWPEKIYADRTREKRPVLQANRMPQFVALARNAVIAAGLRINVVPVDDDADVRTAEVLSALIRNTENTSIYRAVYGTAIDAMTEMGRGWGQVLHEWVDDESFLQQPRLKRILNPFRVKVDTAAEEPDKRDAEFAFYETDYDPDTWKEEFGTDEKGDEREPPSITNCTWGETDVEYREQFFPSGGSKIRVLDWYCAEYEPVTLHEFHDGTIVESRKGKDGRLELEQALRATVDPAVLSDIDALEDEADRDKWLRELEEQQVYRTRDVKRRVIKVRRIDAKYIHEETVWPTPWQPFIPWVHEETDLEGERDMRGVVRDAKDAQRLYNVEISSMAEAVNDAPKNRVVGYRGQFGKPNSSTRKGWIDAPNKRFAFLEVEPVTIDGKPAPFPQPFNMEPAIRGISFAIGQADNDMKATGRFHDASLAERGPQESGVAINARQRQDELSNGGYIDAHRVALAAIGRQLIRLYAALYTQAQVVRITGNDGKKRSVAIFNGAENDPREAKDAQLPEDVREDDYFDIGAGHYDVEVDAAPDAGSRRQEDLRIMSELMGVLPPEYLVNFVDLIFELIDSPVGRKLAERADKMLPEGLKDEDGQDGQPEIPPQVRAKLEEMADAYGKLQAALAEAQEALRTKKLETESRENIELQKRFVDLVKLMVEAEQQDKRTEYKAQVDRVFALMDAMRLRLDTESTADRGAMDLADRMTQAAGSATARQGSAEIEGNQGGR